MPITEADEMMCHQIVSTFDHVENSDLQWTEKSIMAIYDVAGKYYIGGGFGKYTNRNVMDAHAGVTVDSKVQYNVRASRALFPDFDTLKVGPLLYETAEPLKKIHFALDENEYGISFDIELDGVMPVSEQNPQMFRRTRGRLVNHMCRFYQSGRASGWLKVEGQKTEIKKDTWMTHRDRSWGLRSNSGEFVDAKGVSKSLLGGLQTPGEGIPYEWNFFLLQFKDWGCHYEFAVSPDGQRMGPALGEVFYGYGDTRKPVHITDVKHQFEVFPGTKRVKFVHETIYTEDGAVREVEVRPMAMYYRRAGGYLGYKGWCGGLWMGPYWIDGEKMDITDPKLQEELHGVDDYSIECRCGDEIGYGYAQPLIPGIAELITT